MITWAKFQNFKALRDVEVTFESRLTVLVGPNGSGKTSVLRALALLARASVGQDPAARILVGEDSPQLTYTGDFRAPQSLAAKSNLGGGAELSIKMVAAPGDVEDGAQSWQVTSTQAILEGGNLQPARNPQLLRRSVLRRAMFLHLDPGKIAAPSVVTQIPPVTGPDGQGAASTLAYLDRVDRGKFRQVVDALRRVVRNVDDLRIAYEHDPAADRVGDSLLFDFNSAPAIRASSASTGTLLVVGLLSVIFGPSSPKLLLLDDLEYALHPKAQMELVDLLHDLLSAVPDIQIVATSHSPYILDRLEPKEVRVTALQEDGSVVCRPLTDHPDFERWKNSMSPGEFWSTFYEDWLTKSRTPQTVP
jgi:predicted ATPase